MPAVSYGNDYTPGNCTAYVASRVSVPLGMGNATNWSWGLLNAGWRRLLAPGSVGVSHYGYAGHVVYVESINANGILISEMNFQGLGVITYRVVALSEFEWFHK